MIVHVFKCKNNSNRYGFTPDISGKNLPITNCSEWVFWKTQELEYDKPALGIFVASVLNIITRDGFAIQESTFNLSESENI